MKRYIIALGAVVLFLAGAHQAFATAGDIQVTVLREANLGLLSGVTIDIKCAGGATTTVGSLTNGSGVVTVASTTLSAANCDTNGEAISISAAKNGYVTSATSSTFSNIANPNTYAITDMQTAYKVTAITTEGDATDVTTTASAVALGDDTAQVSCTLAGGAWYCPVVLADSDGTLTSDVTADGYVRKSTYALTGSSARSASTTPQVAVTIADLLYGFKVTSMTAVSGTVLSGLTVETGDSYGTTCTEVSGVWYCPVPLADTELAVRSYSDTYETNTDSVNTFSSDRTDDTDPQVTLAVTGIHEPAPVSIDSASLSSSSGGGGSTPSPVAGTPIVPTPTIGLNPIVPGCPAGFVCIVTNAPTVSSSNSPIQFLKSLRKGTTDVDVMRLQVFLNSHGFPVALTGVGSAGFETKFFGSATFNALVKYQTMSGIVPASGFFGPLTRGYVNSHQ